MSYAKEESSAQLRFAKYLCLDDPEGKKQDYRSREGVMYKYIGTHWQAIQQSDLDRTAIQWLSINASDKCNEKTAASSAASAIMLAEPLQSPVVEHVIVPVGNGSLHISPKGEVELKPHDKADGVTYCLSAKFDETASATIFKQFLEDSLPDIDVRDWLQEYVGYTLLPDCRHHLAVWLLGNGGNGKSTIATIIQALHQKPIAMSLSFLDGFKLEGLIGASLVYVDETPPRIDEQKLKTIISGDGILVDRKYRQPVTIRPTAKWIISGNALPAVSDASDGFWRRVVVVPFNTKPKRIQPLLAEQITETELDGVLNWALEGLRRILEQGRFSELPIALQEANKNGRTESNSVASWLADLGDNISTGEQACNKKDTVYSAYRGWCTQNGMSPVAVNKFWQRLKPLKPDLQEWQGIAPADRTGNRVRLVNLYLPSVH